MLLQASFLPIIFIDLKAMKLAVAMELDTVPPETIDPFTEVLPRPICRTRPCSHLGNDAACQNSTEVLPRFAAT